jgi:hypothetical protein
MLSLKEYKVKISESIHHPDVLVKMSKCQLQTKILENLDRPCICICTCTVALCFGRWSWSTVYSSSMVILIVCFIWLKHFINLIDILIIRSNKWNSACDSERFAWSRETTQLHLYCHCCGLTARQWRANALLCFGNLSYYSLARTKL